MFKLQQKTEPFSYDLYIPAVSDTGATVKHKVRFKFRRLSRLAFDELLQRHRTDPDAERSAAEVLDSNVAEALEYCVGWEGVTGPDDQPLEFNAATLRELFNLHPGSYPAIVQAFITAFQGGDAARKN